MRSDLERSLIDELGSVPPNFPVEDIENNVAPNAQILCSLSIGSLLLLSTGILWIDRAAISGKLKKVELISPSSPERRWRHISRNKWKPDPMDLSSSIGAREVTTPHPVGCRTPNPDLDRSMK